jgi:hypothetical protein
MPLSLTIETLADEIHKPFWSRNPYRHLKLRIMVFNNADAAAIDAM